MKIKPIVVVIAALGALIAAVGFHHWRAKSNPQRKKLERRERYGKILKGIVGLIGIVGSLTGIVSFVLPLF